MKKPELRSLVQSVLKEIGNVGVGYKKWGTPGADGYGSNDSKVDDINGDNSGTAATGGILAKESEVANIKKEQGVADAYAKKLFATLKKSVKKLTDENIITAIRVAYEHAEDVGYDKGYEFAKNESQKGTKVSVPKEKINLPKKPATTK